MGCAGTLTCLQPRIRLPHRLHAPHLLRLTFDFDLTVAQVLTTSDDRRTNQATFKIEATDPLTVTRVLAQYTLGDGTGKILDLTYNAQSRKWSGMTTGIRGATYAVAAVDSVGNATAITRRGGYFDLPAVELSALGSRVYLSMVTK